MNTKPTLSQQAEAIRLGAEALAGRRGFSSREREYLAPHIEAAIHTLEHHGEAIELLRCFVKVTGGAVVKDNARAFLAKIDGGEK